MYAVFLGVQFGSMVSSRFVYQMQKMPPNQIPKKEIPFPPDSVEATTPNYFKRRRLTRADVGRLHVLVEPLIHPSPMHIKVLSIITRIGIHHADSQTKITSL